MKKRVRRAVRRLVRAAGYDVVWRDPRGYTLATHVAVVLRHMRADLVIDVGAHHGEYGRMLREVGYRGRIVSFEPMSESFARLRDSSAGDPLWEVHRLAIGAEDRRSDLNVTNESAMASLHRPGTAPVSKLEQALVVERREPVEVRRLDGLPDLLAADERRVFLKTDTQGNDLAVVEGASRLLRCVVGAQLELAITPLYEGIPGYLEVLARLAELGFSPSGFYPVYRAGIALVDVDCVLVRTADVSERVAG